MTAAGGARSEMSGLEEIDTYARYLAGLARSPSAVRGTQGVLRRFFERAQERGVGSVYQVGKVEFLAWLDLELAYRKENGEPLAGSTVVSRVGVIRGFFRYLLDKGKVLADPTGSFSSTRKKDRLPRKILGRGDVTKLLAAPDLTTPIGYRDRTLLEVFYSTGLRREEATRLEVDDIDFVRGLVRVERAKNKVGRLVAIGRVALEYLQAYIERVRPVLLGGRRTSALFVTVLGRPLRPNSVWRRVKNHVLAAGLDPGYTTHSLRHTCATHMLEGGASIRLVAEQLGHKCLSSTVIYTRVSPKHLAKAQKKYHPRERQKNEGLEALPISLRSWWCRTKRRKRRRRQRLGPGAGAEGVGGVGS